MSIDDIRLSQRKASCVDSAKFTDTNTYQLIIDRPAARYKTVQSERPSKNIFKQILPRYMEDQRESRPIGGLQLIKKMDLQQIFKQRKLSKGKIKLLQNRQGTAKTKQRPARAEAQLIFKKVKRTKTVTPLDPHEQTFKEHKMYTVRPKMSTYSQSSLQKGFWRSTEKQRKNYLDKTALIGEINHKNMQSLHAGDKYWELSLRNRWEEELHPTPFVYQIKQGESFANNRVITRLKNYCPDIKARQRLLLKGRTIKQSK